MPKVYGRAARATFRPRYVPPTRKKFVPSKAAAAASTLNYYTGAMANAKRMSRGIGF